MKYSLDDIISVAHGYLQTEIRDGYLYFSRFTPRQIRLNEERNQEPKNHANAGMRLIFFCPAGEVSFEYDAVKGSGRDYYGFDVCRGDALLAHAEGKVGERGVCRFLNETEGVITVWLPVVAGLGLRAFCAPAGIRPVPQKKRRLFIAGDSITQGYDTTESSRTYANLLTAYLDAECLNQAIGGDDYFADNLGEDIRDFAPDTVFVSYGTNDWAHEREIGKTSDAYLAKLRSLFPDAEINVILPVYRFGADDTGKKNRFDMTLADYREVIRKNALRYGYRVLNGMDFMPHEHEYYWDGQLHPNTLGFKYYFEGVLRGMGEGAAREREGRDR